MRMVLLCVIFLIEVIRMFMDEWLVKVIIIGIGCLLILIRWMLCLNCFILCRVRLLLMVLVSDFRFNKIS